ncbi:MAG: hypothetical protein LBE12_04900 [Planctomycetaceae bacterium]|nr:hypothetical protein [Planctomycetaceae bacterium]
MRHYQLSTINFPLIRYILFKNPVNFVLFILLQSVYLVKKRKPNGQV